MDSEKQTIDEGLYSRQLYAIGKDAMHNMSKSKVFISGMSGLGVEIAKCVILSGVNTVNINDSNDVTNKDLSSNYYLTGEKGNRADAVAKQLSQLNPYVRVTVSREAILCETLLSQYGVVVICDADLNTAKLINKMCRKHSIKFIYTQTFGPMGFVFCDFGDEFIVNDADGEQPKEGHLVSVEGGAFVSDKIHDLMKGDKIKITLSGTEFETMIDKVKDKHRFVTKPIEGASISDGVLAGAIYSHVKQPTTFNFKSLEESISNPDFVFTDMCDFNRPSTLHLFMKNLYIFCELKGRAPRPWNDEDAEYMLEICKMDVKEGDTVNEDIIRKLSYTCTGELCPIASVLGSIVAQEVIKAASYKFTPMKQWLYFDALTVVPDEKPSDVEFDPESRYCSQEVVFGKKFQQKMKDSKVFIVGSGAIGCEHLKNFAMMGVGNMVITDMDTIEKSNLNRQFLFRNSDIGSSKSETAARAAMIMNPDVTVIPQLNKVGSDTMHIYNAGFFDSLTCVANALDNVQARLFMDNLCITYKKPLLESGTLGTKGNVQTVIPHLTKSYGMTADPPEQSIPVCTLKNFPYLPEHTIPWARDVFEGFFTKAPNNYNKLFTTENFDDWGTTELIELHTDVKMIIENAPKVYKDCVLFAHKQWHEYFSDTIANLVHKFPADFKNDDGTPFWSGTKKCPVPIVFDPENMTHVGFVNTFAKLWSKVFNVEGSDKYGLTSIQKFVRQLKPPKRRTLNLSVATTEEEEKKRREEEMKDIDAATIKNELHKFKTTAHLNVTQQEFEKDDDTNYHIDFITYTSNMRSENYSIPQLDRFKTKGIAGKIIPALATTTSLVSGLVALELYKVISGFKQIEKYRDAYINLAISFLGFSEPQKIKKKKIGLLNMSLWDSIDMENPTIEDMITYFDKKEISVLSISYGDKIFLSSFLAPAKRAERMKKGVIDLYAELISTSVPEPLTVSVIADIDDDADDIEPIQCNIFPVRALAATRY
jgi:ubiquitin-activating enzyme E1